MLELLIVLPLSIWSGYALWKRGPAERLVAIILLCAIVVYQTTNPPFAILHCTCCGYALWYGGAPERISTWTWFLAVILTRFAWSVWATRLTSVEVGVLAVDLAALAVFVAVALRAERFWPIWFTALHAIAITGHVIKMVDPDLPRWGYGFAIVFWSYPMMPLLAFATWCHRRRLSRNGFDPDWSSSLLPGRTVGRAEASG
jgi:hypothetical protein